MHRCYYPDAPLSGRLTLRGEEAHHALRVMRLRDGDCCEVFDGRGNAVVARVLPPHGSCLELEVQRPLPPLPRVADITLALAIPKGSHMDLIIQKAVEMGVSRVIPLVTERTIVRFREGEGAGKANKWRRTALEACKQCGVNQLPIVEAPQPYRAFLQRSDLSSLKIQCALTEHARPLRELLEQGRNAGAQVMTLLIGPEGDFSPAEYEQAVQAGFAQASLGPIILRVETAVFVAVASARYALDT